MTGPEKNDLAVLQIEMAVMKRDMDSLKTVQDKILEHVERTDAAINQAKGAKWMLFAALPLVGGFGAWLQSFFGGGTGTH